MDRTGSRRTAVLWTLAGVLGTASGAGAAPQAGLRHAVPAVASAAQVGADPAADAFERSSLGSNWSVWFGNSTTVGILNGSDLGFLASSPMGGVSWVGSAFSADQFCETVISPDRATNMMTQVFVRRRSTDNARYGFHYNAETAPFRWEIKYDGVPSASTRILGSTVSSAGPAPGDTIRVEIQGTTIRGFHNGVVVVSATDTAPQAITTAGPPGMAFRLILGTSTTYPSPAFESWTGGSLSPSPLASVSLVAPDAGASEAGLNPGTFRITRTGGAMAAPLTVNYTVAGTADGSADYAPLPGAAVIPGGSGSVDVAVTPLDDTLVEGSETVILTLSPSSAYVIPGPASSTVTIADDDAGLPGDADGDGLSDSAEAATGTDPNNPDMDGDGMPDGAEVGFGLNPLSADEDLNGVRDGLDDWNGNGVNNLTEVAGGSSPGTPWGLPPAGSRNSGGGCGATGGEILLLWFVWLLRRKAG